MEIKTYLGRKLNYVNGIYRRQIELDRYLKDRKDVKLTYEFYLNPKNPVDFFSNRYFLYPLRCHYRSESSEENIVNHITFQYLGDLSLFLNKKNTIITCHDIFGFLEKKNVKNPFITKKYSILGLKKCRYIISISNFTKNELINKLGVPKDKIVVIKNGMNREMFQPIPKTRISEIEPLYPNFKKIIHVGTEEYRKDFVTLLKAFYNIKKKYQNIKLIRIGEPRFVNIIKNLGLINDIIYLKDISNTRLNEIYNLCDFLVYPSLYEGWGAPGLEAASSGLPVICSDISIFREVYKNFPLYFKPKDYKTLANLILENINNESLKKELKEKGLNVVKQYSWIKASEKYLKLSKFIIEN